MEQEGRIVRSGEIRDGQPVDISAHLCGTQHKLKGWMKSPGEMTTPDLDAVVVASMKACGGHVEQLNKEVRERLYPALLEMERRFDKQQGARTDLKVLDVQGWHEYLESRMVNPATFRSWKSRNAVKELEGYLLPPKPKKKKKPVSPELAETEHRLMAQGGLRLAKANVDPFLTEAERAQKCRELSEELIQAAEGGVYELTEVAEVAGVGKGEAEASGVFDEDTHIPIPLPVLADRMMAIADELRCAHQLDGFADQIDAIASDVERREELDQRMLTVHKRASKAPTGCISQQYTLKSMRRDRRFQDDIRLILKAGGTTYRGMKILGGDDPYIVRFTRKELMAEFKNDLPNQLGVGAFPDYETRTDTIGTTDGDAV